MYRMPLNYNPVMTKGTKITNDNDTTRGTENTSGIENSRGTEKSKSTWNQLFTVKPRTIVNSNQTINSKASMSAKVPSNSRDNVYSNESFDTSHGMNYKNQSERETSLDFTNLSPKKLQEAIIWSEILGKPVSKREKRR